MRAHAAPKIRKGFSYIRFSTPDQLRGDSLRRQTALAQEYCAKHGLELDSELSLRDMGVSAFRGANADVGALGEFLRAVDSGLVPRGSCLLVESFDRLTRDDVLDAQHALTGIILKGVTIVVIKSGGDGEEYSEETIRAAPHKLFVMLAECMRANSESVHKSARLKAVWKEKRLKAARGEKVLTSHVPAWLRVPIVNGERCKPEVIPERAAVIRRIFDLFLRGQGKASIAKTLNRERVPTFGNGSRKTAGEWRESYVYKILRTRTVLGELTPHTEVYDKLTRKTKRVPGEPIAGYYPAIIDETTFANVQLLLEQKSDGAGTRPASHGMQSLLATLARCPACGGTMTRVQKGSVAKAGAPKLVCSSAKRALGCTYVGVNIEHVHTAIIAARDMIASAAPGTDSRLPGLLADARTKLSEKDAALNRLVDAIALELNPPAVILERIRTAQAERDALAADVERLEKQLAQTAQSLVAQRVEKLRVALSWFEVDRGDISHANAALRECFESVTVDYLTGKLVMNWRHGPPPVVLDVPALKTKGQ
jgi:DNA invertase Pin-like site-specific DNA recombinase